MSQRSGYEPLAHEAKAQTSILETRRFPTGPSTSLVVLVVSVAELLRTRTRQAYCIARSTLLHPRAWSISLAIPASRRVITVDETFKSVQRGGIKESKKKGRRGGGDVICWMAEFEQHDSCYRISRRPPLSFSLFCSMMIHWL